MAPTSKDDLILSKLKDVYSRDDRFSRFQNVLHSPVSIRLIEHFVMKYAQAKRTTYEHKGRPFIVYNQYTQERQGARKTYFDPFARGKRIDFTPDAAMWPTVSTTMGQLSFFAWAFDNGVMDYIDTHVDDITEHMKESKPPKDGDTTKRRTRVRALKSVTRHNVEVLVRFDDA